MNFCKICRISIVLVFLFSGTAIAEDSEELKEAKEKAAIAEEIKNAAEHEKDTVKALAEKAIAEQEAIEKIKKAKADSEAAEYQRDKDKADLYKAIIPTAPDPEKLKAEKLTGLEFKTAINQLVFQNTSAVANTISTKIIEADRKGPIILNSASNQKAPSIYMAVANQLEIGHKLLAQENSLFKSIIDGKKLCKPKNNDRYLESFSGGVATAYVASELLKTVMGFAVALKPQYALSSNDVVVDYSEILYEVTNKLISNGIKVIDPEKIISINPNSKLDSMLGSLNSEITNSQIHLQAVNNQDCELTTNAINGAKKLKDSLDIVTNSMNALFTANDSGLVKYDQAKKSEELLDKLKIADVGILHIDIIRRANDTFTKNSIFSSTKVFNSAGVQVKWSLTKPDGSILLSGIEDSTAKWNKVNLPE